MAAEALPPGPGPIPRNLLAWTLRPVPLMEQCRARYGDRFTIDLGPPEHKWVFLTRPDDIRELFSAPADVLHPGEGARVLEPLVGKRSVLLLDGAEHLAQRKLMLPAFHGERMRALTGVMEEVADAEVASWRPDAPFTLHQRTQALTLEVILRAVFGAREGKQLDDLRVAMKDVMELGASPLTLLPLFRRRLGPLTTWGRFVDARAHADTLLYALIEERRQSGEEGDDVLTMLLAARDEDGNPMTDRELRDELVTLLVAGHETTASSLAWGFEQLVREPAVLERVTRAALEEDTAYLEATVKEILRRRPVLPIAQPRRIKQPVEIGGHRYEPGQVSLIGCIYLVHHDARLYPEPYAFRPERFLDGNPGKFSWIPFGGGVRRCLGAAFAQLEMKIALRAILGRVEVASALDGREGTRRRSITLSPRRGTPIEVRPRVREQVPAAA
jgi:cytochrome P450